MILVVLFELLKIDFVDLLVKHRNFRRINELQMNIKILHIAEASLTIITDAKEIFFTKLSQNPNSVAG